MVGLATPAAHAASVIEWHATSYVWTGPNAQAECTAMGKQEIAGGVYAYGCRPDTPVAPSAIQLWLGIWVGCPTC